MTVHSLLDISDGRIINHLFMKELCSLVNDDKLIIGNQHINSEKFNDSIHILIT